MKKWILLLIFSAISLSAIAQEKHFYDLNGMEDSTGKTHLFYRIYQEIDTTCAAYDPETDDYTQHNVTNKNRNIYHFDPNMGTDSLFIRNFQGLDNFCENEGLTTKNIEFFEAHPDSFITYTVYAGFEATPVITDFKDRYIYLGMDAFSNKINFNPENNRFIFGYSHLNGNYDSSLSLPRNSELWEQGYINANEIPDSLILPFQVYDFDANTSTYIAHKEDSLLFYDETGTNQLYHYSPFDNYKDWNFETLDDTTLIYASNRVDYTQFNRNRSLLKIDINSQLAVDTTLANKYFEYAIDSFAPYQIFISDSLDLLVSADFGDSFESLLTHQSEITGLYKKPGANILYVLTRQELLEVNTETGESTSLKNLPVSNEPKPHHADLPSSVELHQNYPNPFNPVTVIGYRLSVRSEVRLEVFDITGRRVAFLVNERQSAGQHQVSFNASTLSSGVYLYRLTTGELIRTRKMILIK